MRTVSFYCDGRTGHAITDSLCDITADIKLVVHIRCFNRVHRDEDIIGVGMDPKVFIIPAHI